MQFRKPTMTFEVKEERLPTVAFICPACNSEVSIKEIIEKNGSIGCAKCLK